MGEGHQQLLARLVERLAEIRTGGDAARVVLLVGETGAGKSRLVRELYRELQAAQPVPGYWPPLREDDAAPGRAGDVVPLPLRKVVGPEAFTPAAGTVPSFTWWALDCARLGPGDLVAVAQARPALERHLLPALRAKATHLGVGGRVLGQLDAVISGTRAAGELPVPDHDHALRQALNQALDALGEAPVARLGALVDFVVRGMRARRDLENRALEREDISRGEAVEGFSRSVAEEFADLVLATAHPRVPAVVVLEDAHLMDASVRQFVARVAMGAADRPVLVLASMLPGGPEDPAHLGWEAWLTEREKLERWQVPELPVAALAELVRRVAPATAEADAHALARRYPNPLALRLVLALPSVRRAVGPDGALRPDALDLAALPTGVTGLYAAWARELPEEPRRALAAAVGGMPARWGSRAFLPDVVGAAAEAALGVPREQVVAGLARACDDGVSLAAAGVHEVRDPLLAAVLADGIDPAERTALRDATRAELRRYLGAVRGDRCALEAPSERDVVVAGWLTELTDRVPATVEDAVALTVGAAALLDARQYRLGAGYLAAALRLLPADHTDTVRTRNDLAYAHWAGGDLARAVAVYEEVLGDALRLLGPDHPGKLAARNNLAYAYWSAGKPRHAIPLYEAVVADRTRLLGADHPNTLTSRNHLAGAVESAGNTGLAIAMYESLAADRQRVLGADHPDTLRSRSNLAYAHESVGDMGRALALYESVAADRQRVLGEDHPDTLTARNNLAGAYESVGRLEAAVALFEKVAEGRALVLGPDHPDTLTALGNLAGAHAAAGDPWQAIPLLEAVTGTRARMQGPEHPDTLWSANNLAGAYKTAGEIGQAIRLFEAVAATREQVLGADHPDTLVSRNNLAGAYESAGDVRRAMPLYESVAADSARVLGAEHLDTLRARNNLAYAHWAAGDLAQAVQLFEQVQEAAVRALGPGHRFTAAVTRNLAVARRRALDG